MGKGRLIGLILTVYVASGFGTPPPSRAAAVLDRTSYDLVVVGGTPGGVAMAVRAAREGLDVLLLNHTPHLGGILSNGLSVWDTLYEGRRSPIYDELRQAIFDHYRSTYGPDSPQYRAALPGRSGHTNGKFEAKVFERLIDELVAREAHVRVLKDYYPAAAETEGALIRSVTLRRMGDDKGAADVRVTALVYADCTYEGDLLAVAKARYRVGRESRSDFHEPHAGVIYMGGRHVEPGMPEALIAADHDRLNLRKFRGWQTPRSPQSTGEGDGAVQAYNYRTVLSSDPANRVLPEKPKDYDPLRLRRLEYGSKVGPLPNNKIGWNRPQVVGPQSGYPDGDWSRRHAVMQEHWDATIALLYYLQNDPSVDEKTREEWRPWGLALDEFTDNGHRPHEIYVREARRLVGRYIFTEHDASLAAGLRRTPVHEDSVGITEWYMDCHACTPRRIPGALEEGKMMLEESTFPGQVPYRCLLPEKLDNLLVPVCLSATHVSWGTVRLEPTWMNIAESAGFAAALAVKQKRTCAQVDTDELLRVLAERHVMISFFNDVDVASEATWVPAVQYLGTKGFFCTYDAQPDAPLTQGVAKLWAESAGRLKSGRIDPTAEARAVFSLNDKSAAALTVAQFAELLNRDSTATTIKRLGLQPQDSIRRSAACEMIYDALR